jgi:hypothetical protein
MVVTDTREAERSEPGGSGLVNGLLRSLGVLLQAHLQYAQKEASTDAGRLLGAVVLLGGAALLLALALVLGELAAVYAVARLLHGDWLGALLVVAGADLLLALLLMLWARAKLRQPLLKETRVLLRRTVSSLTDG